MSDNFAVHDGGSRITYPSGMCREGADGKLQYWRILEGPMLDRWVRHVTRSAQKYPDVHVGRSNWTLAESEEEYQRFIESAFRHFIAWARGERDEDHAAAVFFNINGAEYIRCRLSSLE